jgi:hypothetical protein
MALTKVSYSMIQGEPLNVLDFGASPSASATANTAAIQQALNAALAQNRAVYVPAGVYELNGTLNYPGRNVCMYGEGEPYGYANYATPSNGYTPTTFKWVSAVANGIVMNTTVNYHDAVILKAITLDGGDLVDVGITATFNAVIYCVKVIRTLQQGILLDNAVNQLILERVTVTDNQGNGLKVEGPNSTIFHALNCNFSVNDGAGVYLEGGDRGHFQNCVIESNQQEGISVFQPTATGQGLGQILFENCWLEANNNEAGYNYSVVIDGAAGCDPYKLTFSECNILSPDVAPKNIINIARGYRILFDRTTISGGDPALNVYEKVVIANAGIEVIFNDCAGVSQAPTNGSLILDGQFQNLIGYFGKASAAPLNVLTIANTSTANTDQKVVALSFEGADTAGVVKPAGRFYFQPTSGAFDNSFLSIAVASGGALSEVLYCNQNGVFFPATDDTQSLGSATNKWSVVYAGTGTINTSDERAKQDIESLSDAEKRVAVALKRLVKKFRFKDAVQSKGDGARIHVGVVAQEIKSAFEAEGLDASRYGLFCYDEWADQYQDVMESYTHIDEQGREVEELRPTGERKLVRAAGNQYGIRYEELFAFVISAL